MQFLCTVCISISERNICTTRNPTQSFPPFQTHVDNSFGNSFQFTQNNIFGTHVSLILYCPYATCAHAQIVMSTQPILLMLRFFWTQTYAGTWTSVRIPFRAGKRVLTRPMRLRVCCRRAYCGTCTKFHGAKTTNCPCLAGSRSQSSPPTSDQV